MNKALWFAGEGIKWIRVVVGVGAIFMIIGEVIMLLRDDKPPDYLLIAICAALATIIPRE